MADAPKNTKRLTRKKLIPAQLAKAKANAAGRVAAAKTASTSPAAPAPPPTPATVVPPPKTPVAPEDGQGTPVGGPPVVAPAVVPLDTSTLRIKTHVTSQPGADTSSIFTLPLDNADRYKEVWNLCSELFEKFKGPAKDHTGTSLKVEESGDKLKIVSLDKSIVFDKQDTLEVVALMLLFRYRDLVEQTSKKKFSTPSEFFNELEANREYHARAIVLLPSMAVDVVSKEIALALKVSDMDALDRVLFEENNKGVPFAPYEKAFLVTHMMIKMAEWEKAWLGANLFKDPYMVAVVTAAQNKDLPSHLRLLANGVNNVKEQAMNAYPQSFLMNYSMFYPFVLYPTGLPPNGEAVKPVTAPTAPAAATAPAAPAATVVTGRVPAGTRKYANGREVPYYAENNTPDHRKLPDGWFSSTSSKINPDHEFFFKETGEATWQNPIDYPNPELVKKARAASEAVSPPSTPPASKGIEDLPEGWTRAVSKTTGKTYYKGPGGKTQWEWPGSNGRIGERQYDDGRVVPYWDKNDKSAALKDSWLRSVSEKVNPGQSFYFKKSGEASWENPNEHNPPKLVSESGSAAPATPPAVAPLAAAAPTNGRVGTRTYKDGREVPYWDVNDKSRKLSDGWYRSVSELKKKGEPFYFKKTGEATWENPINNPNPKLASKAKTEPSTPPTSPKA